MVAGFDNDQVTNAATIISVGADLGVPVRGWIIAVATAIQESSLRNLDHGDAAGPDSRGLFQQRAGWGSRSARTNPATAARLFFLGGKGGQDGLLDIPNWQTMPLTQAAQAVQHSAHPNAYAPHENDATRIVTPLSGLDTTEQDTTTGPGEGTDSGAADLSGETGGLAGAATSCAEPGGPAATQAVAFARQQIGIPYRWGGDGPAEGGFDCSGLTKAAYAAAGIDLPRTAQTQYDAGPPVPDTETPHVGDLLFFGTSTRHVTHVGIYIGNNQMIDAPHRGANVRVENYRWKNYLGATRPG